MARQRSSAVKVLGVVVAALVTFALPASATSSPDNMYKTANTNWSCHDSTFSSSVFCQTDNAAFTIYFQNSVTSTQKSITKGRLNSQYNPTDLNVSYLASPVYTGPSETDIIYQTNATGFSGSTIGRTWCDDAVTSVKCDQHYVRFRGTTFNAELACHETGHAVGLTHGREASPKVAQDATVLGCMETPDHGTRSALGSHNVSLINATY